MNEYIDEMKEEMDKSVRHLSKELARVRTGRASIALLDDIKVDYYGAPTPLSGVASLSVPEPRMIIVKPWDATVLPLLERAIGASRLGITPNNDGKIIRLVFPELTGDRRKELSKQVSELGEQGKVGVRSARREYNELFKGMQKDGEMTEDELKRAMELVQEQTNGFCSRIDDVVSAKEKEILEV